jgi:hypothetical protein
MNTITVITAIILTVVIIIWIFPCERHIIHKTDTGEWMWGGDKTMTSLNCKNMSNICEQLENSLPEIQNLLKILKSELDNSKTTIDKTLPKKSEHNIAETTTNIDKLFNNFKILLDKEGYSTEAASCSRKTPFLINNLQEANELIEQYKQDVIKLHNEIDSCKKTVKENRDIANEYKLSNIQQAHIQKIREDASKK